MRQIFLIVIFTLILFAIEFLLFHLIGRWGMPNLLLLLVIFFTLYSGIRYGLLTAFVAGFVRDSFSIAPVGTHILAFVLCAYGTSFLKTYIYHNNSRTSRLLLVFVISLLNLTVLFFLNFRIVSFPIVQAFQNIFIPEIITTLVVTHFVFYHLKTCVSKFYV